MVEGTRSRVARSDGRWDAAVESHGTVRRAGTRGKRSVVAIATAPSSCGSGSEDGGRLSRVSADSEDDCGRMSRSTGGSEDDGGDESSGRGTPAPGGEGPVLSGEATVAAAPLADSTYALDTPSEVAEIMAAMQAANHEATRLVADNLDVYLRRNGTASTYEGWIGTLHPENVTLDSRLLLPGSTHLRLWKERELERGRAPAEGSNFWKAVAGLARGATSRSARASAAAVNSPEEAVPVASVSGRPRKTSRDETLEMPTDATLTSGTAAAELCNAGSARGAEASLTSELGPADASDVETLEAARAEVSRLRALLAQRGGGYQCRVHASEDGRRVGAGEADATRRPTASVPQRGRPARHSAE